ncbi:UNVERIFIED_CONTAM: hypothetical protein PYX00_010962 [Menopon gallinae]|uniref:Uncharacterized protein n=1 Tax=Menopon gallinae TaxID=328185 RepID=A0AAW2H651_9NEOP
MDGCGLASRSVVHLRGLSALRRLSVSRNALSGDDVVCIGEMRGLESLDMSGCAVDRGALAGLRGTLAELDVSRIKLDERDAGALGRMRSLRRLVMHRCGRARGVFRHLGDLKNLEHLSISRATLDAEDIGGTWAPGGATVAGHAREPRRARDALAAGETAAPGAAEGAPHGTGARGPDGDRARGGPRVVHCKYGARGEHEHGKPQKEAITVVDRGAACQVRGELVLGSDKNCVGLAPEALTPQSGPPRTPPGRAACSRYAVPGKSCGGPAGDCITAPSVCGTCGLYKTAGVSHCAWGACCGVCGRGGGVPQLLEHGPDGGARGRAVDTEPGEAEPWEQQAVTCVAECGLSQRAGGAVRAGQPARMVEHERRARVGGAAGDIRRAGATHAGWQRKAL